MVVDRAHTEPEATGVYCIFVNGILKARHLAPVGFGKYAISSESGEPMIEFTRDSIGTQLVIVGRVIIAGRWVEGGMHSPRPV